MKVLAAHAHPDDVEFQCAGTLALLRNAGHEIAIMTVANGDCGSKDRPAEVIAQIRAEEARRSAKLLDGQYYCCGVGDLQVVFDNPTRRKVVEVFRTFVPDIVLSAPLEDYMLDHEIAGQLARDACFTASLPNYATGIEAPAPYLPKIPYLYYVQPLDNHTVLGESVRPQFCIDISSVIETKKSMLACHESQREWLRIQHKMDQYIIAMEQQSAEIGKMVGVQFAEGFRQHVGNGHPKDNILQSILAESFCEST